MSNLSLGDLALAFQTRSTNTRLKADLQRLGTELTTGRVSDLRRTSGGDISALADLERAMSRLESYRIAASEAELFVSGVQRALDTVQETGADLGPALLQAGDSGQATLVDAAAVDARARFATVVSVLNTQVAGRSLLSGVATGDPALASSDAMLADLATAVAAETTAAGVETAIEAWFDTVGGGFETSGYLGSDTTLAPFRIGPNESTEMELTAADPEFRDLFKGYAMAALIADGSLTISHEERAALIGRAGERLMTSTASLADIRAGIGGSEARIDQAASRNEAEFTALEIARNGIVAADPYRTATELQAVEAQLETLYTITARLSRLSLTDYLR